MVFQKLPPHVISVIEQPHKINASIAHMILKSGRSWWQAQYRSGKIISEWNTLTGVKLFLPTRKGGSTSRWEEVAKKDMIRLRILCPNGMCGELEDKEGGRFIQLKVGGVMVGHGKWCDAHIIGLIPDINGNCFCRAWEVKEQRLTEFYDNVLDMKYRHIGKLNLDVQGVKI
jgi:hypothetical protein